MRLMAITAADTGEMHAAAEKRSVLVIFLANLAIGIKQIGLIRNAEGKVIKKHLARGEVSGQFAAPRVAGAAGIEYLICVQAVDGRILFSRTALLMLPGNMLAHGPVARFAADAWLRHFGGIGIRSRFVIFSQARVVADRAHRIPIHAAPSPVAPFAGAPVLLAKHVEPITLGWIKA